MKTPKATGDARTDAAIKDIVRDFARVLDCGRVDVTTAGAPVVVQHALGRVPDFFTYLPWQDFTVFATEEQQSQWTDKVIVLCPSAAGTFRLFVGGL